MTRKLDKFAFFADLGYEPHPGQIEVHESTAPRRVVACGVRWGKTWCAAAEGLCAAMQPAERSMGWVVAPTYDLADKVFREILLLVARHLSHRVISMKENDRKIVLRNMAGGVSEIRGKSADNSVSLLGEGLDWLIVDEAARLKPMIWDSHLSQRLIDKKGWSLLISTPRGKGWFYEHFRRGRSDDPDFESWNQPSWSNPHLDATLIEQERDRLPERVFDQEYGGKFVEGSGSVFRNVRLCATGDNVEPQKGARYWGGVDLAKVTDFTVITIIDEETRVVFTDRFHRLDWSIQVDRIREASQRYNNARLLVDSTGAGEPVFESMRRAGCNVHAYPFTAASKSALVDNLALMIEGQHITLPKPELWPEGIEELEAFQFSVTDNGHVRTGAPGGLHDDCVMSLGLAAWQRPPRRRGPVEDFAIDDRELIESTRSQRRRRF